MTPVRSCVGCGGRDPQPALMRLTFREGMLHRDGSRREPGRGGYLHDRDTCWRAFVNRRGPIRSLRATVPRGVRATLVETLHGVSPGRIGD